MLFKLLGTQFLKSSGFDPEIDGHMERVNLILEIYLRHYVQDDPKKLGGTVGCVTIQL